jgi:DNA-binding SARP family transcriptional activator/predicted ATPase
VGRLSLYLLGRYQIQLEGQELEHALPLKGSALLAYLAMERGAQRRDKLAGLLWPDCSEAQAHHNLSQALYGTRIALALSPGETSLILGDALEVQLNPQAEVWVDAREFLALLEANEQHAHPSTNTCPECFERLHQARALYQGGFLEDFSLHNVIPFDEWCLVQRERLHRQHVLVLQRMAEHHAARGEMERALELAWQQVELDPLSEAAHRQLMRLLSEGGQRSQALAHFHTLQHTLQDSLGVAPDSETLALVESIQKQERSSSPAQSPSHLPQPLTPFFGREEELNELCSLLRDPHRRLISVLGPGGSGKTRLALQAARAVNADYPDGVYLVPLSSLSTPESLTPAVASALGFSFQEQGSASVRPPHDQEAQLREYLRDKQLLLLFDSFESVLEGASWLAELLRIATQVKAFVTTRARLNVRGEQLFSLSGMDYPEEGEPLDATQYSAVALFLSGARRAHAGFELSAANSAEVARICRLVEGMPLGILLAAAWVKACTPAEIVSQIEASLDFLSSDWVDVPARKRSLRATLDYSWRLLGEQEQEVFSRLSVLRGVFSNEAAGRVAGAQLGELRVLADKCMLEGIGQGLWRIHDLLRQYAAERLAEDEANEWETRDRHSAYYFEKLQDWGEALQGPRQAATLLEIDEQVADLQAAWSWVLSQAEVEYLDAGLQVLGGYYGLRGRNAEARLHYEPALRLLEQLPDTRENRLRRVDAILKYSYSAWRHQPAADLAYLAEAEHLLEGLPEPDEERLARLHFWMGRAHYAQGTVRQALGYFQQMLPMARQLGNPEMLAIPSSNLAQTLIMQGFLGKAEPMLREAIPLFEELGDRAEWIRASIYHGYIIAQWDYEAGLAEVLGVLERAQELNYLSEFVFAQLIVAGTYFLSGNALESALQTIIRCVENARQCALWGYVFIGLGWKGWIEARLGQLEAAETSMAEAQVVLHEKLGGQYVVADQITAARAELALIKGDFPEAIELAQTALSMAQASGNIFAAGIARGVLGQALARLEPLQWEQAEEQMAESLHLLESGQMRLYAARTRVAWGKMCRERGDLESARQHWLKAAAQFEASKLSEDLEQVQVLIEGG